MTAFLTQERWDYCACLGLVILIASAILLPGLGDFGLWQPHELDVLARARASAPGIAPLNQWSIRAGLAVVGVSELGARLPLALMGVGVAALTFVWAARVTNVRTGVYTALLVVASPLFVLQSRQLTSAIGVCLGLGCAMTGAALSLLPTRRWHRPVAVAVVAAGLACAYAGVAWRTTLPRSPLDWSAGTEQVVFGAFPWIAALPLAARWAGRRLARSVGWIVWVWAVAGFVACTWTPWHLGVVPFCALPALALPVAMWLDGAARKRPGPAAAALIVSGLIAVVVGRDLIAFPGRLPWLHLPGTPPAGTAAGAGLKWTPLVVAVGFFTAVALAALLGRHRRAAARVAVAVCVGFAALIAAVWMPRWSRNHSARQLFDNYRRARSGDEPLAVIGVPPRAVAFYAPRSAQEKRAAVDRVLAANTRGFAIVPGAMLCRLSQRARKRGASLSVLARNRSFVLLSNQYRAGDPRVRSVIDAIRSQPPAFARPVAASFAAGIELLGVDMPARVGRGDSFDMTLYFKVVRRLRRDWRVFVHFDRGTIRFQGDHWPLQRRCGTIQWNRGDYIVDRFSVSAGNLTFPKGRYRVHAGFFVGRHGAYTNMKVTRGVADRESRVDLGTLEVR